MNLIINIMKVSFINMTIWLKTHLVMMINNSELYFPFYWVLINCSPVAIEIHICSIKQEINQETMCEWWMFHMTSNVLLLSLPLSGGIFYLITSLAIYNITLKEIASEVNGSYKICNSTMYCMTAVSVYW